MVPVVRYIAFGQLVRWQTAEGKEPKKKLVPTVIRYYVRRDRKKKVRSYCTSIKLHEEGSKKKIQFLLPRSVVLHLIFWTAARSGLKKKT